MAFKRVDEDEGRIEGWSFVDSVGDECTVSVPNSGGVSTLHTDGTEFGIYKRDIPTLIKALQASYEYEEE